MENWEFALVDLAMEIIISDEKVSQTELSYFDSLLYKFNANEKCRKDSIDKLLNIKKWDEIHSLAKKSKRILLKQDERTRINVIKELVYIAESDGLDPREEIIINDLMDLLINNFPE